MQFYNNKSNIVNKWRFLLPTFEAAFKATFSAMFCITPCATPLDL